MHRCNAQVFDDSGTIDAPEQPMTAKLKVAVIGGTGLLGSHLVAGFLANGGYHVTVVTREVGDAIGKAP